MSGNNPAGAQPKMERGAFLLVGLGASAGALEPLGEFFSRVPADSGLAYTVVQHLEPNRPSLLPALLAKRSALPVSQVVDGEEVEPDHIFIIPPNHLLTVCAGRFRLAVPKAEELRSAIDTFFQSIAEEMGERAVGVILSGSLHDGTAGLRAIRERGGLTIAQAPETAEHADMPRNAIDSGLVDRVLAVPLMGAEILEHARQVREGFRTGRTRTLTADIGEHLEAICAVLARFTGHNFRQYKEGTLLRRIRRRIDALRLQGAADYLRRLEADEQEARELLKDLLIGVSQFFRDPESFAVLEAEVIRELLDRKPTARPIRIWVAGCASGEEVYSIAMLVREHQLRRNSSQPVQIFATDIDSEALGRARRGRYPLDAAAKLSPERLARFFTRGESDLEVVKELRDMCIFSLHNLVQDPPFSSLDLISCRNVLIYLDSDLQRKLVPLFHYALRPSGFVFLGPSEGLAARPELFLVVDKKHRLFRRNDAVLQPMVEFPLARPLGQRQSSFSQAGAPEPRPPQLAYRAFERMVLEEYAPPCVAVNEHGDILFLAGRTGRYLQPPAGDPTNNLFELVSGSLRRELRAAITQVAKTSQKVVRDGIPVEVDGVSQTLRLAVRPLPGLVPQSGLFAVVFQEAPSPSGQPTQEPPSAYEQSVVEQLETELRLTRAELQSALEEMESTNEELKSSNEELISTNEELQSANEEFQTSREELQVVNDELATVNANLQQKVQELARTNSDLQNLLAATQIATIFLDLEFCITRFTPAATALFNLIESDVGRFIGDLAPRFVGVDLLSDIREVLRSLSTLERQIHTADQQSWFTLRILPYRTLENIITGVVITFADVSALKRNEIFLQKAEAEARQRATELDVLFDSLVLPVIVFDKDANPVRSNPQNSNLFPLDPEALDAKGYERLSRSIRMRYADGRAVPAEELPSHRALRGETIRDELYVIEGPDGDERIIEGSAAPLRLDGEIMGAAVAWRDMTQSRRAERALRENQRLLQDIINGSPTLIFLKDLEGRYITANRQFLDFFGLNAAEIEGKISFDVFQNPFEAETSLAEERLILQTGSAHQFEHMVTSKDGSRRTFLLTKFPLTDPQGQTYGVCGIGLDITDRKSAEAERLELERRLLHSQRLESLGVLAGGIAHDFNNLLTAILGNLELGLIHSSPMSLARENIQTAIKAACRATDLTRQMLAYSGRGPFEKKIVDINELVRENAHLLRAALSKQTALELILGAELSPIEADPAQVQQVVMNLITNASEALPQEGGRVLLQSSETAYDETTLALNLVMSEQRISPGRYSTIRVTDTGCGMDESILNHLFDPFFTTKTKGRGLGMSAVLGIMRAHKGGIFIESAPGKGTTVTVLFPSLKRNGVPDKRGQTKPEALSLQGKVLVVDDEPFVRDTCTALLATLGIETLAACDGVEALEIYQRHRDEIACVILDVSMPRLDGPGACKQILAINPEARILMASGYHECEEVQTLCAETGVRFIKKPYQRAELQSSLALLVQQS